MAKSREKTSVNTVVTDAGKDEPETAVLRTEAQRQLDEATSEGKSAPAPAKEAEEKKRDLQPVPLRVFLTVCGKRPDQTAGFAHHAKTRNYHNRTIPDWHEAYAAFMTRPVK